MKNNDQEWLDALAGKSEGAKNSLQQFEATAVRRALLARRESIESEVTKYDPVQFEKLKRKLIQHGHLANESNSKSPLRRKIQLIGTFIAGSFSTSLLILGLTSNLMVTRGAHDQSLLDKAQALFANWKVDTQSENMKLITWHENDPVSIAHTLEEKAWEAGLQTNAYIENNTIVLRILNFNSSKDTSEIKLLLGLHPEFSGSVTIKISK